MKSRISESWLGWLKLETAETGVLLGHVSLDSDVSLLAPAGAPGVLDEPVVGSVVGAVSNEQDTVVKAGAAEVLHDAAKVQLPAKASIDTNGDWTVLERGSKGLWVLWRDVREASHLSNSALLVAGAVSAGVWILSLGLDLVRLDVGEGVVHETAVAALVALFGGAVDELLLGEGVELVILEEVGALHGTSGGEGPAGAA